MLKNHDLKDKSILVLGGSTSVGKYVVQLAKLGGAKTTVTTNSARSNELVTRLGSTHQIDYTKNIELLNPVLESVKELGELDYIYDTCGNSDLFGQISTILKPRSTGSAHVSCVGDSKFDYNTIDVFQVLYQRLGPLIRILWGKLGFGINYSYVCTIGNQAENGLKMLRMNLKKVNYWFVLILFTNGKISMKHFISLNRPELMANYLF
jgi:hypothetical protein